MKTVEQAILKTLLYSDIFDCPMTKEEIWSFLIVEKGRVSRKEFDRTLQSLSIPVSQTDGYYYIRGRKKVVGLKKNRSKESAKKKNFLASIIRILSLLPTVQLIGLSGAVAVENADRKDDIDLFIITKKNTLWLTRFLVTGLLSTMGVRRKRFEKKSKNKICLNMFMDEKKLEFIKEKQDLFIAHETAQMVPLFSRDNSYQKFLSANTWIKKYMPNSFDTRILGYKDKQKNRKSQFLSIIELFAKKFQLFYMKNHRTNESISKYLLGFHPVDYRSIVLTKYKQQLYKYSYIFQGGKSASYIKLPTETRRRSEFYIDKIVSTSGSPIL